MDFAWRVSFKILSHNATSQNATSWKKHWVHYIRFQQWIQGSGYIPSFFKIKNIHFTKPDKLFTLLWDLLMWEKKSTPASNLKFDEPGLSKEVSVTSWKNKIKEVVKPQPSKQKTAVFVFALGRFVGIDSAGPCVAPLMNHLELCSLQRRQRHRLLKTSTWALITIAGNCLVKIKIGANPAAAARFWNRKNWKKKNKTFIVPCRRVKAQPHHER